MSKYCSNTSDSNIALALQKPQKWVCVGKRSPTTNVDLTMAEETLGPFLTSERENSSLTTSEKVGKIIILIRSQKESISSFSTILSIAVLLIMLGIIVNGVICFVMLRGKRYKKNTSNFFILHLSVAELVFRLLVFPLVIYFLVPTTNIESVQCKTLTFVSTAFISATFVSLVAIAADRFCNIVYPMEALKRKTTPFYLVLLVWLYATVISIPSMMSVKSLSINDIPEVKGFHCKECSKMKICDIPQNAMGQASTTLYFIFSFLVPLCVIFALYTKIAIFLYQRSKNRMMHKMAARSKYKAVRMLTVTVLGYTLSLGPSAVFSMLRSYGVINNNSFSDMLTVTWVIEFETLISSLGNPIIYAYYSGDFRKELVKLCRGGGCVLKNKRPAINAK